MKLKLILELPEKIKIYAEKLNWVLEIGNKNNRRYFHSLDQLCDELFDLRLSHKIIDKSSLKTTGEISRVVGSARKQVREDIEQLKDVWNKADRERQERFGNGKGTSYP
jgi:hypothetical protein